MKSSSEYTIFRLVTVWYQYENKIVCRLNIGSALKEMELGGLEIMKKPDLSKVQNKEGKNALTDNYQT